LWVQIPLLLSVKQLGSDLYGTANQGVCTSGDYVGELVLLGMDSMAQLADAVG